MVLRRYTPPTCTLEIVAKGSSRFRWAGISAFKDLQFELHFDAPQLPEEQQVTIRGDRAQLDALQEAVSAYVRQFLSDSPAGEKAVEGLTKAEENGKEPPRAAQPASRVEVELEPTAWELDALGAAAPVEVVAEGSGEDLPPAEPPAEPPEAPAAEVGRSEIAQREATGIYLVRRSLVVHELFLGSLATEGTGPAINLSSLQLFDLATALDEYTADVVGAPRERVFNWLKQPPLWAKTVAVVAVTLGVATAGLKLVERQYAQMAAPAAPPQPVAQQPPPAPAPAAPPAPPQDLLGDAVLKLPKDGAMPPTPPAAGAVASKLPALPVPATSVPPPLKLPAGTVALTPGSSPPAPARVAVAPPPAGLRRAMPVPPPTSIHVPAPALPAPAAESALHEEIPPLAEGEGGALPSLGAPAPPVGEPEVALSPSAPPPSARASSASDPAPALPPIPGLPDGEGAVRGKSPEVSPPAPGAVPVPAVGEMPVPAPHSASPPRSASGVTPQQAPQSALPEVREPSAGEASKLPESQTGTTSLEMPQLAEARNYFAQRWRPPLGLKQPLEYTISVNADGSVGKISPRGQASHQFVESTGMPVMNQPFVSPVRGGEPVRIRVLLKPDGAVQTLVEP
ncbi:DUF4335 domain-containing protein [Kamptonema formosum]|uniref:DUF4335 domain-containing protein n=1 Tax=Kamptonema formosum TaxID=331992 RepID=UPI000346EAA8|nr:DUF4335 domain-containing protein [Oscillatoria sp. PCC 10802]